MYHTIFKSNMQSSPEMFLVILAIAMCSILFFFTVGVVIIFHCCKMTDLQLSEIPTAVLQRTRNSFMWARNSMFSRGSTQIDQEAGHSQGNLLKPPPAIV